MTEAMQRDIEVNGVRLRVTEQGEGPLVLLCHGWPELAHSWRHQLPALAEAGYRAVAPDMRGYGGSDAPEDVHSYSLLHLVGDMVGLVAALGEREAVIVGHDWGATVAWNSALLRPDLFPAVAAMSVPYRPRGPAPPLAMLRAAGLDRFYWLYFQQPGVAEAEFERDPAATLRRILGAAGSARARDPGQVLMVPEGGGFLDLAPEPVAVPPWLGEAALAVMADAYRRTGFRGGLNYYRNLDRNWELLAPWQGVAIRQPALFIAGTRDVVITGPTGQKALEALPQTVPGLRRTVMIEGAGHWIQQERPQEVNAALTSFLAELG
ncbi:MAG: alpha/beta hydrolase [Acetobacteraceae bacterium]|nr:alpha/beta hydrolase [Acetobacteraceae bacterium]